MKFSDKYLNSDGIKIHYLDNDINSDELIVILPPGFYDARFIDDLKLNIDNKRFISITYPSRYKSDELSDTNSVEKISDYILKFLEKFLINNKEIKNIKIIGFSFGTTIATIIVQKLDSSIYKCELCFVNPGEYFNKKLKSFLKFMFSPARKYSLYRKFLKLVLCNITNTFDSTYFPESRLKAINDQWLSILDYELSDIVIDIPTVLIIGEKDMVIDKNSIDKLESVFINSKKMTYSGNHLFDYLKSKDYIESIKPLIMKFINR